MESALIPVLIIAKKYSVHHSMQDEFDRFSTTKNSLLSTNIDRSINCNAAVMFVGHSRAIFAKHFRKTSDVARYAAMAESKASQEHVSVDDAM